MVGKHSSRRGRWIKETLFRFTKLDEDGSGAYFSTSKSKTDTPTTYLDVAYPVQSPWSGIILRIHYRLTPTNAVTYTLRLFQAAIAADYESNMNMIYESPSAQASGTDYDRAELSIPFVLASSGILYYSIEWSAAPGVTAGFIEVTGEVVE